MSLPLNPSLLVSPWASMTSLTATVPGRYASDRPPTTTGFLWCLHARCGKCLHHPRCRHQLFGALTRHVHQEEREEAPGACCPQLPQQRRSVARRRRRRRRQALAITAGARLLLGAVHCGALCGVEPMRRSDREAAPCWAVGRRGEALGQCPTSGQQQRCVNCVVKRSNQLMWQRQAARRAR